MENSNIIIIGNKGGKGGGSSYRQPVEDPNTLRSMQYVSIVDAVSEGPIVGVVDREKGIYLNETPLLTQGGTYTMRDVAWEQRVGYPTQAPLPFDGGNIMNEHVTEIEITNLYPRAVGPDSGEYTFQVTNTDSTKLRVTLGVKGLYYVITEDKNRAGDIVGNSVGYKIIIKNRNNKEISKLEKTLSGKTTGLYLWSHEFDLDNIGPWTCTVSKTTGDNTLSRVASDLYLSSYTEIIGYNFTYPYIALFQLKASAESFSSRVPTRAFHVKGLLLQIPSNYNPLNHTTVGIWDGTFKTAWTNNPAWVFYDLVTNDRYGVASYLAPYIRENTTICDKWLLYEIAQICDAMVSDGYGGREPRFCFNQQIMGAGAVMEVLQSIASVFHGMSYFSSGTTYAKSDYPTSPLKTISQTNVINGKITYATGSIQERHSVVHVRYNNMKDMGKSTIESVYDWDLVELYGYREITVTAMGCTSRGQAYRHGLWYLATEAEQIQVEIECGLDSFAYLPGDIVRIADPDWMGFRSSGRVVSIVGTTVTLDAPFTTQTGETYKLAVYTDQGTEEFKNIISVNNEIVTIESAYTSIIPDNAVWSIHGSSVLPKQFAIRNIRENQGTTLSLELREVNPYKYAEIESGLKFDPEITARKPELPAITGLAIFESTEGIGDAKIARVNFSWFVSATFGQYTEFRTRVTDNYKHEYTTDWNSANFVEIQGRFTKSTWKFEVMGRNLAGNTSDWASITYGVEGLQFPPTPTGFQGVQDGAEIDLIWQPCEIATFSHYEIRAGFSWEAGIVIEKHYTKTTLSVGIIEDRIYGFTIKAVTTDGLFSEVPASTQVNVTDFKLKNVVASWSDLLATGTLDNTQVIPIFKNWQTLSGNWETYPTSNWHSFGSNECLTLVAGQYQGSWTSEVKDLLRVVYDVKVGFNIDIVSPQGGTIVFEMRSSLDNITWTGWTAFVGTRILNLRYLQVRIRIEIESTVTEAPYISHLLVVCDMPDVIKQGRVNVSVGGLPVVFDTPYTVVPSVNLTADGGDRRAQLVGSPATTGFTVSVVDPTNTEVEGTVNWVAAGY